MGTLGWRLIGTGAALAAGAIASRLVTTGWRLASGHEAPVDPSKADDTSWKEALLFAAITGIVVQAARVAAERKAAQYYRKSTGHLPGEAHPD